MKQQPLFQSDSIVAQRQTKTDRLILHRFLKHASTQATLVESVLKEAHAVLLKWANLESSGKLQSLNETQMQGEFLAQVFGEALGYAGPLDGVDPFHRQQHPTIAGETPDAALGIFSSGEPIEPLAVVELKGPRVHLDRDRSNGRMAVAQCWDYLNNTPPACRWGIVSNYVSFRLYERNSTKRRYEHFSLQSLRDFRVFREFYVLFHRQGLVDKWNMGPPRGFELLRQTAERQREVGEKLYDAYSANRIGLIEHLHYDLEHYAILRVRKTSVRLTRQTLC